MKRLVSLCILLGPLAAVGISPATTRSDKAAPSKDTTKLEQMLERLGKHLNEAPGYRVESRCAWTYQTSDTRRTGENLAMLQVGKGGRCRLEIKGSKSSMLCVSDGKTLTRLYIGPQHRLYTRDEGNAKILLLDRLTALSLRGSGLEVIAREGFTRHVIGCCSGVRYLGEATLDGQKTHHFKATWNEVPDVEMWFSAGKVPLLLQISRQQNVLLRDKESAKLVLRGRLTWKMETPPAKAFQIEVPKGAREVADLHEALTEGTVREWVGKQVPPIALTTLAGKAVRLDAHKGSHIVVLTFWSTGAAPSSALIPRLSDFATRYGKKGVVVYAVNVGEKQAAVKNFIERVKFTGGVLLDPERKAAGAFGVSALPVTVLVGKDGIVQAVHVGLDQDDREGIVADLEKLLRAVP